MAKNKKSKKTSGKNSSKGKKSKKSKKKEKQPTRKLSTQDKQLRNFLIVIGIIAVLIWGFFIVFNSSTEFTYKDVKFKTVKDKGGLIFYKTLVPLYDKGGNKVVNYRFYLRNHPKEIEEVPIPEELELRKFVIFNYSNDMLCEGDGNIAMANIKQLYSVVGAEVKTEPLTNKSNITCDEQGRYNYINIKKGEKTKIEKIGPACYEMTFKDCEILEVTERYMVKMFVQTKDIKFPISNIQKKNNQ